MLQGGMGIAASVRMMLDFLGEDSAAARVEKAMADLLASGDVPSADARSGIGTSEMGDMVVGRVRGGSCT